jgi:hypothetical protein
MINRRFSVAGKAELKYVYMYRRNVSCFVKKSLTKGQLPLK